MRLPVEERGQDVQDQRDQERDGHGHVEVEPHLQPASQAYVAPDSAQYGLTTTQQDDELLQVRRLRTFLGPRQPVSDKVDDGLLIGIRARSAFAAHEIRLVPAEELCVHAAAEARALD